MKRRYKFLLVIVGLLALLLLGARFYLNYKANNLLKYLVKELTNNTYTATSSNVVIDYFPAGITIQNVKLQPVEEKGNYFKVSAAFASLHIKSIFGLVAYKNLNVVELELIDPVIESYGTSPKKKKKTGISETLNQINTGLLSTFRQLQVQNALIKNGTIRVETGPSPSDYVLVNHITIGIKDFKMVDADTKTQSGLAAKGNVKVTIDKPDLHIPDSSISVQLGQLQYSTESNALTLDEAQVAYEKKGERSDSFKLSSIRVSGFEWLRYINEGMLALDTVLVDDGTANLNLTNMSIFGKRKKVVKDTSGYTGEDISIKYFNISDIKYTILTTETIEKRTGTATFKLIGNNLSASNFSLLGDRKPPVDVGTVNINITEYSDKNTADQFTATLEALSINNRNLTLKGYKIVPMQSSTRSKNNLISVPELLLVNYDLSDLLQKTLTADQLIINDPIVVLDILKQSKPKKTTKKDPNNIVAQIASKLDSKINISEIEINNGSLKLQPQSSPTDQITLQGISLQLDANKLLKAEKLPHVLNSIKLLRSKGFLITGQKINLKVADLRLIENGNGLYFGRISGNIGPDVDVDLFGVSIIDRNVTLEVTQSQIMQLSDIVVDSGFVTVNNQALSTSEKKEKKKSVAELMADNIDLKNVVFRYRNAKGIAASSKLNIQASDFHFTGRNASWQTLDISSTTNSVKNKELQFDAGRMEILQPGFVNFFNPSGHWQKGNTSVTFKAPEMAIKVGISNTDIKKLEIQAIDFQKPAITVRIGEKLAENFKKGTFAKPLPALYLQQLTMHQPTMEIHLFDAVQKETIITRSSSADIVLKDFQTSLINDVNYIKASGFSLNNTSINTAVRNRSIQDAITEIALSNISYNTATKQASFVVDNALLKNIDQSFTLKDSSTLQVKANTLGIRQFEFKSGEKILVKQFLQDRNWWAEGLQVNYDGNTKLNVYNLNLFHNKQVDFSFDSLTLDPKLSRDSFWARQPFQKDYIPLKMGKTSAKRISYVYADSSVKAVHIPGLSVDALYLHPQRDKRFPDDTVSYRPLLAEQLKALPIMMSIDSLHLTNSEVRYNEISKKGREGFLSFTNINGSISNIKNHDFGANDSLRIRIQAKIMGTGQLSLHYRQSYTDSLQSFLMTTRMGAFDLKKMNSMAEPLGVRIKGGRIDSLYMRVRANDLFAYGQMDVRYKSLRLKVLGKDGKERFFLSGVVDWLANLILRGKDNGRADLLFKNRVRNKGTFNYWGKIFAEGMLTNFGIKRDKKERKQFLKELKNQNLKLDDWE